MSELDMDEQAAEAAQELVNLGVEATVAQVADWWRRWYMKAGHKRLGRILLIVNTIMR